MNPHRLIIAVAGAFLSAASFWMSLPLVAVSLRAEGVSDLWVGLISCLPWLGLLAMSPFLPWIIARLGLQRTVLSGMVISVFVFAGFAATRSVPLWSLLYIVQGGTVALRWAAMDTWINGAVPDHARGRLIGMYELVASGSMAAGPAFLVVVGTAGAKPFLACALAAAIAAALLWAAGREAGIAPPAKARMRIAQIFNIERAAFISIMLVGLVEASDLSLLPLFGLGLGVAPRKAALLVVFVQIGVAAGALLFGALADRFNRRAILLAAGFVAVGAPLALPFALGGPALWPVLLAWGLAQGGLFTLGIVLLGARFKSAALAPAIAVSMVVYTAGGILGPPLMGGVMAIAGPAGLAYGLAVISFLALVIASCFEVLRPHVVMLRKDSAERPV